MRAHPLLAAALVAAALPTPVAAAKKPHVLFILADDYGWNDVGYHQNQVNSGNPDGAVTTNGVIPTPTIDKLSAEGVRLENYYVEYLCSPTRGTVMTGRYASHTGIGPQIIKPDKPYGMPARETLWPELMKDAGYATHMIGKWHLGICNEKYTPTYRGFDTFFGYLLGAEDYFTHQREGNVDLRNATGAGVFGDVPKGAIGTYSSTLFANEASRIIAAHDPSTPLFMYLPFQSVHGPLEAPQEYIDRNAENIPHTTKQGNNRLKKAAMVSAMDDAIAMVVDALKANQNMYADTVVIFSTDNGGPISEEGNNYPLRGWKATAWEGGVRGVAWVRGTDSALAPLPQGVVNTQLMHTTDWLPTVVRALAKGSTMKTQPLDGYNQWSVLTGEKAKTSRNFVVHVMPGAGANITSETKAVLRKGKYKLYIPGDSNWASCYQHPVAEMTDAPQTPTPDLQEVGGIQLYLFNVKTDPTESQNLALAMPEKVAELLAFMRDYQKTAVDDLALSHKTDKASDPNKRPDKAWGPWGCDYA